MLLSAMDPVFLEIPVGGHLCHFYLRWLCITTDPTILDIVAGMHIELSDLLLQCSPPPPLQLPDEELQVGDIHIQNLLDKKTIVRTSDSEPNQFLAMCFSFLNVTLASE